MPFEGHIHCSGGKISETSAVHTPLFVPRRFHALGSKLLEALAAAQLRGCSAAVEDAHQPVRIAELGEQPLHDMKSSPVFIECTVGNGAAAVTSHCS
jgi:hypothetical protein